MKAERSREFVHLEINLGKLAATLRGTVKQNDSLQMKQGESAASACSRKLLAPSIYSPRDAIWEPI